MSNSEFIVTVETSKPDPSCDHNGDFGVLTIKLDGVDITRHTTAQQDAMLREALEKIFYSVPKQTTFD